MGKATAHDAERWRLKALQSFLILDSEQEAAFDAIVARAARLFGVHIAAMSLVDHDRLWFKARVGFADERWDRAVALCDIAIRSSATMVVPDLAAHPRLAGHPSVTGPMGVRFYAAAPLVTWGGHRIGTICVFDTIPHPEVDRGEIARLRGLADEAMELLEERRRLLAA